MLPPPATFGLGAAGYDREASAIEWARGLLGSDQYPWLCERFVENAFNVVDRYRTAWEAAKTLPVHKEGTPPRGALVFFVPDDRNWHLGHVGIAIRGRHFISALDTVQIQDLDNDYWRDRYYGWARAPDDWEGRFLVPLPPDPGLQQPPTGPSGPGTSPPGGGTGGDGSGGTTPSTPPPSVKITAPSAGKTLTGTVTFTAHTETASGVDFDAFYATNPADVNTLGWHRLGAANALGGDNWALPYDTHAIPDQGNAGWGTVNVRATATDAAGARTGATSLVRANVSNPPPAPVAVRHYDCGGTANAFGHYVPAGRYWSDSFVTQGNTITGGYLLLGANVGDHDHTAHIGIYTGANKTGLVGEVLVQVSGYGGVNFSFPAPIAVSAGQPLWIAATGVGDFTAYDQNNGGADGCFIGHLDGFQ